MALGEIHGTPVPNLDTLHFFQAGPLSFSNAIAMLLMKPSETSMVQGEIKLNLYYFIDFSVTYDHFSFPYPVEVNH